MEVPVPLNFTFNGVSYHILKLSRDYLEKYILILIRYVYLRDLITTWYLNLLCVSCTTISIYAQSQTITFKSNSIDSISGISKKWRNILATFTRYSV